MRALQFTAPSQGRNATVIAEVDPPRPGPDEVAIAVSWAGINFKDVMQRRGDPGYVDHYPFVPGLEVSGTVRAAGPGVSPEIVGRPVCAVVARGGLAEVVVASHSLTVEIPEGLTARQAAAAPGALTSAALLVDTFGHVGADDVLLVHSAAGAVGQAIAQVAHHRGASHLVGIVGARSRVAAALSHGYDDVFVRGETLPTDFANRIGPNELDLVIDPLGTAMLDFDLQVAAPGTRIIISGNATGAPMADPPTIPTLMTLGVQVGGFSLAALMANSPNLVADAMSNVLGLMRDGVLTPALNTVSDLSETPAAHDALAAGTGEGKYVVAVGSSPSNSEPAPQR